MEGLGRIGFSNVPGAARKKRSNSSRRPRSDSQALSDFRDVSSLSSTPPSSNNMDKLENGGSGESDEASDNGSFLDSNEQRHSGDNSKRHSEGVLAPANWRSTNSSGHSGVLSDGLGNETKVKKVKLKVGGIIRTINAKPTPDAAAGSGSSSAKSYHYSDTSRPQRKLILQENSDDNRSFSSDNGDNLQGLTWKDLPQSGLRADGSRNKTPYENMTMKLTTRYEPVRKSKRVPKRRSVSGVLDDGSDDEKEVRYLEKVRKSKVNTGYGAEYVDDDEGGSRKQLKISSVLKRNVHDLYDVNASDYRSRRLHKESKKSSSGRVTEDIDYLEEEEPVSDDEPEIDKKKAKKEFVDVLGDSKKDMTVTTRRRALQAGKDVSLSPGASLIEFPNGLPPVPPRKQKEKLSEVEQQLKRTEALQRRRMQVEKAARESEAEAIRKILGQDSSRKKREDKIKKRQEEMAQEKAANAMILASDTVRWIMGPLGTVVTFPNEVGLPSIFDHKPCSYPPPREKCAAPSCTNPYKYRDSKSKLPLCSLQCYKAIHGSMPPVSAC
ncbi:hypothetical protein Ddye_027420 [Dipteronia dyeriana]|uniref:INO80 complex subunit B-like conserved region domain-containing protein n=1 Tax=Dipteronia dyeriana TaxID=168575 RepID=A0AAD9TQ01_9ROSI|nr:hypothetical protein Ddye_027420 [Dipteronia dyeriana]